MKESKDKQLIFKELGKKSDKDIIEGKKILEIEIMKFSREKLGFNPTKGNTKAVGSRKRIIAKINTILNQRGLSEELCKNKPKSKRRMRRLRRRNKK